jgi:precorrin-6B methylase 1
MQRFICHAHRSAEELILTSGTHPGKLILAIEQKKSMPRRICKPLLNTTPGDTPWSMLECLKLWSEGKSAQQEVLSAHRQDALTVRQGRKKHPTEDDNHDTLKPCSWETP